MAALAKRFAPINLFTSLILIFPLFLVYEVGVLALPNVHNGADLITTELLHLLHGQIGLYLLVNGLLAIGFVLLVLVMRQRSTFHPRQFIPLLIESTVYALSMGSLIIFVMQDVLHVSPGLTIHSAATAATVASTAVAHK